MVSVRELLLGCICFSNKLEKSYRSYKQVGVVKLINNYSNNKLHGPHGFKEEIKIKYDAVKAISGRLPNGTAVIIALLEQNVPALT